MSQEIYYLFISENDFYDEEYIEKSTKSTEIESADDNKNSTVKNYHPKNNISCNYEPYIKQVSEYLKNIATLESENSLLIEHLESLELKNDNLTFYLNDIISLNNNLKKYKEMYEFVEKNFEIISSNKFLVFTSWYQNSNNLISELKRILDKINISHAPNYKIFNVQNKGNYISFEVNTLKLKLDILTNAKMNTLKYEDFKIYTCSSTSYFYNYCKSYEEL